MKRKTGKHLLLLLFLLPLLILLQNFIQQRSQASLLKPDTCFTESFREQALSSALYAELEERVHSDGEFADLLTTTMLNGKFFPKYLSGNREAYLRFKPKAYYDLRSCYLAVWKDLENFPIPIRNDREIWQEIFYENTFGAARSYGGSRTHEGCDLFGRVSQSGFYPVISMTDGKIEKIGWLPLGGYRIGIRAPAGAYFYYAHLSEYAREFQAGDRVSAGELLGYMGDTGYGEEGTTGQFPVHLHLGIYIKTEHYEELSINPYWILRYMEKKRSRFFPLYFSGDFGMIEGNVKNAG